MGFLGATRFYAESVRSYKRPRRELANLQSRKLKRILRGAGTNLAFYKATFAKAGVKIDEIAGVEDLRRLPLITKGEVVTHRTSGLRRVGIPTAASRQSTGTTGSSVTVDWSGEQLDVQVAMLVRRMAIAGFRPWKRLVTMWPPVEYWARSAAPKDEGNPTTLLYDFPLKSLLSSPLGPLRALRANPGDPPAEARALKELAPDFLMGRPSFMRRVGLSLRDANLSVSPEALLVGGEVCTGTLTRELEELYGSKTMDYYGSSEFGAVASECRAHAGAHLFEDFLVCEVLEDGEAVAPGEEGELVITSLHNEAMPLIRYRTGDLVRLSDGDTCACGSNLTRVSRFLGRAGDSFMDARGMKVLGAEVADQLEEGFGLRDYQVVRSGNGKVVLRLSPEQATDTALVARVESFLEELAGNSLSFAVEVRPEMDFWLKSRPVVVRDG